MAERLHSVSFAVRRPNEYTRWRPRIERGNGLGFGLVALGPFLLSWQTERKPDGGLHLKDLGGGEPAFYDMQEPS